MPSTGQILGLAAIGKSLMDTIFYQHFVSKLAVLVTLAAITGIMAGILAAGLFYGGYLLLLRHGLEADAALFTVGLAATAVFAVCAALTVSAMRQMHRALQPLSPIASGVGDIANAFVGGLRTPPKHD